MKPAMSPGLLPAQPGGLIAALQGGTSKSDFGRHPQSGSFVAALDHAASPAFQRSAAHSRNSRETPANGDGNHPRTGLNPHREEQKKRGESRDDLAGASAVVSVQTPPGELNARQRIDPRGSKSGVAAGLQPGQWQASPPVEITSRNGEAEAGANARAADSMMSVVEDGILQMDGPGPGNTSSTKNSSVGAETFSIPADQRLTQAEDLTASSPLSDVEADAVTEASPANDELVRSIEGDSENRIPNAPKDGAERDHGPLTDGAVELQNRGGTTVAKIDLQMKNTVKQDEIAASAKQELPGSPIVQLRVMPTGTGREGKREGMRSLSSDSTAAVTAGIMAPVAARVGESPINDASNGRLTLPGRITEIVSREVQMFKRAGDDSIEVVLTPDQHTEISLRLQWRDGKVEIFARCERGDYQSLNLQWTHLQSALAHQGVRLSHLTQPTPAASTSLFAGAGFDQTPNGARSQYQPPAALEELSRPIRIAQPLRNPPPRTASPPRRLLESWA